MSATDLIANSAGITCADGIFDVNSPCVSVCQMDAVRGLCSGCLRTLDEIAAWGGMDANAKRAVWVLLAQRRVAVDAAVGAQA